MRTKFAAVVSRTNAQGAPLRTKLKNGVNPGSHGGGDGGRGKAINNNLKDRCNVAVERAFA